MRITGGRENVLFSAHWAKRGLSSTIGPSLESVVNLRAAATPSAAAALAETQASLEVFSHLPRRPGRQLVQMMCIFTRSQPLQRPLPLHRQY